jgi:hypothetical protein
MRPGRASTGNWRPTPSKAGAIKGSLSSTQLMVITALLGVWAPVIALVTATPVRWVEGLLQAEGAHSTPVAADPELTQMERLVMGYSTIGLVLAVLAMAGIWADGDLSGALTTGGGAVLLVAVLAQGAAIRRWRQRSRTLG